MIFVLVVYLYSRNSSKLINQQYFLKHDPWINFETLKLKWTEERHKIRCKPLYVVSCKSWHILGDKLERCHHSGWFFLVHSKYFSCISSPLPPQISILCIFHLQCGIFLCTCGRTQSNPSDIMEMQRLASVWFKNFYVIWAPSLS